MIHAGRTTTQNTSGLLGVIRLFGRRPNQLTKVIGGAVRNAAGEDQIVGNGWTRVRQREFPLTVDYDLPAPTQPVHLEGANAPAATTYQPVQDRQIVQIYHDTVELTYLAESEVGRFDDTGVLTDGGPDVFSYSGEARRQLAMALGRMARDFNHTSWNGVYDNPTNPGAVAMQSRGVIPAITTNVLNAGGAMLTRKHIEHLYERMNVNSGVQPEQGLIVVVPPQQMIPLNDAFTTEYRQGQDRTIGGLRTTTFYTPFGVLGFATDGAWDPDIPQDHLVLLNPTVLRGRFLPKTPDSPSVLIEELAKVGSADRWQLYAQLALDYGAEWMHGKLTGLGIPSGSGS